MRCVQIYALTFAVALFILSGVYVTTKDMDKQPFVSPQTKRFSCCGHHLRSLYIGKSLSIYDLSKSGRATLDKIQSYCVHLVVADVRYSLYNAVNLIELDQFRRH